MNYETSKILGGIGAIMMFIGIFPIVNYFGVLELIGAVIVLVALYGLSGHFHDPSIFKNAIIGIVAVVVGVVASVVVALTIVWASFADFLYQLYPGWDGAWSSLQGMTPDTSQFTADFDFSTFLPIVVGILAIFIIMWVFAILGTFFIRHSLKRVSTKSGVSLFGTAGTLLLAGAFLIIVFGLGLILMWIAALLLAIAFFQLNPAQPPAPSYSMPPQTLA
jgi:uncharacterized membrane protein